MKFDTYVFTHIGGMSKNDDSADYRVKGDSAMFVVSDGLGGLPDGDKASRIVVNAMLKQLDDEDASQEYLKSCIENANEVLLAEKERINSKMKSTLAVLNICGSTAICGNVGDTRLYYISGGDIAHITPDHSVAYKKYRAGEITYEQIGMDEDQSSLLCSMGDPERCLPNIKELSFDLKEGDGFLLCTDGVWKYLNRDEILADCLKSITAENWTKLILMRLIERMEKDTDNLTMIAVKIL